MGLLTRKFYFKHLEVLAKLLVMISPNFETQIEEIVDSKQVNNMSNNGNGTTYFLVPHHEL